MYSGKTASGMGISVHVVPSRVTTTVSPLSPQARATMRPSPRDVRSPISTMPGPGSGVTSVHVGTGPVDSAAGVDASPTADSAGEVSGAPSGSYLTVPGASGAGSAVSVAPRMGSGAAGGEALPVVASAGAGWVATNRSLSSPSRPSVFHATRPPAIRAPTAAIPTAAYRIWRAFAATAARSVMPATGGMSARVSPRRPIASPSAAPSASSSYPASGLACPFVLICQSPPSVVPVPPTRGS